MTLWTAEQGEHMALGDCTESLFHFPGLISMAGNNSLWPRHSVLRLCNSSCGITALFIKFSEILLWWPRTSRTSFLGVRQLFSHCLATADASPRTRGERSRRPASHSTQTHKPNSAEGEGLITNWWKSIRLLNKRQTSPEELGWI